MFFGMLITGGLKLLHIFPPYIWMLILLVGIFYSVKFLIKKSQKTFLLKLTIILGMIICLWAVDYYSFNILSAYLGSFSNIFMGALSFIYYLYFFSWLSKQSAKAETSFEVWFNKGVTLVYIYNSFFGWLIFW